VIVKITRSCISNTGSADFIGFLLLPGPPHIPSETIFGGATEQTLKVIASICATETYKPGSLVILLFIFLHNTKFSKIFIYENSNSKI